MALFCNSCKETGELCDNCKHFWFDKGWCNHHKREEDPLGGCDDYVCQLHRSYPEMDAYNDK